MSWLLQRYPISFIMPLTIPSPLLSVLFALVAFGLPLTIELALGGMMTIVGVAIITMQSSRKEKVRKAGFSQGITALEIGRAACRECGSTCRYGWSAVE